MKFPSFFTIGDTEAKRGRLEPAVPDFEDEDFELHAEPPANEAGQHAPPTGTIGAILVAAGRLGADDALRVVQEQAKVDAPFGETAVRLGLVSESDVQFALSQQFALPCLPVESEAIAAEVVAAFLPGSELVERLRILRGQIAMRAVQRTPPLRCVALISHDRGCGRSYIAANLATVFAQLGTRTLLIDANFHHPRQHELFRLSNRNGLSSVLAGRTDLTAVRPIPGLPGLAVLPAGPKPPNPDDLLARAALGQLLRRVEREFEVILVDTPAWSQGSAACTVAAAAGAAVQIVQPGRTGASEARLLAHEVGGAGGELIGVVMNRP
jgi:chain length determinant protein tyrosine kinase EpsG